MSTTIPKAMPGAVLSAEDLFDSIGPAYEEAYAGLAPQLDSIQWALAQIQHVKPAKVLDIGCGTGKPVCAAFVDAGHDVLGIDISGAMLQEARKRVPKARFVHADLFETQLELGTYDAITSYFSMEAALSQDSIRQQIHRIHDSLKPGGVLVLATIPISRDKTVATYVGRTCISSGFSATECIACVEDVGFQVLYQQVSNFTPKAVEAGICKEEENTDEDQLFVYARKKAGA